MGIVVRLFFLVIICSILLSFVLGWLAVLRARSHLLRSFGFSKNGEKERSSKVIDGEYRVLSEEDESRH